MSTITTQPDGPNVVRIFLTGVGDVPALIKMPTTLPDGPFHQVRRVGGTVDTIVSSRPRIDVITWGSTDTDDDAATSDLARAIEAQMLHVLPRSTVDGIYVAAVRQFLGPTPTPDPETGRRRYMQTIEPRLRGIDS